MKKSIVITVLMIYSLATFGVSVNYFFCCGKLKEVSVKLNPPTPHKCPMKGGKDCCKNETVDVKISADQHFSQQITFEPFFFVATAIINYFDFDKSIISNQQIGLYHNKPPPLSYLSLNILHSNFRI